MHSIKLICVFILVIVLCASSCRTGRQSEQRSLYDSLQIKEIRTQTYVPVPMSRVELKIPQINIHNLPDGSGYTRENDRARVTFYRQGDTITITATCDSLQRIVMNYEMEVMRLHRELEELEQTVPCVPTGWQWFWIRLGQLGAVLLLLWIILLTIIRKIIK